MKAHSKSDVQVSDRDGSTSSSNKIKAKSKIVEERIWINPVTSKDCDTAFETRYSQSVAQGACDLREQSRRIYISSSTREMSQMK